MNSFWIVTGLVATALIGGYAIQNYNKADATRRKEELVSKIMYKYGNKNSPDYSETFDAPPQGLMQMDLITLQSILRGEMR